MPDEPIQPDWVGMPGEAGPATASANHNPGRRTRRGTRQRRPPKDVPIAPGEDEILDEAVEVRRFAGLANRLLSVLLPLLIIGLGALTLLIARSGQGGLLASTSGTPTGLSQVQAVRPTETLLMVWRDGNGAMASASVLGRTASPVAGQRPFTSVLVFSPDSRMATDRPPLRSVFDQGDGIAVASELATAFNIAIDGVAVLEAEGLALVAENLASDLLVDVAEPLLQSDGSGSAVPIFSAGEQALAGADVSRFIALLSNDEDRRNHLARQRDVWDGIRLATPIDGFQLVGQPAGGMSADLADWFSGLGTPSSQVFLAETARSSGPGQIPLLEVDLVETTNRVASVVPNPRPGPGQDRPRVRLLDAHGDDAALTALRRQIVILGGSTASFGPLPDSGSRLSRVVLHQAETPSDPDNGGLSAVLADALGVQIERDFPPDSAVGAVPFDFTVVVGDDPVQDGGE